MKNIGWYNTYSLNNVQTDFNNFFAWYDGGFTVIIASSDVDYFIQKAFIYNIRDNGEAVKHPKQTYQVQWDRLNILIRGVRSRSVYTH